MSTQGTCPIVALATANEGIPVPHQRGAAEGRPQAHPFENERLASLRRLALLDTPRQPVFDWLAGRAADELDSTVGIISLVDEDRLWFKASVGLEIGAVPRAGSGCDWVVARGRFFEVPDLLADRRFQHGPMARGGLRRYAGSPIFGLDGLPVGTVCVLDPEPRRLDDVERLRLEQIADLVTGQLHLARWRSQSGEQPDADAATESLRRAVHTGEIVPFYQPIVAMADGSTVGCEALARWRHPSRGWLTPAAFLDIAERDDLILDLDKVVLDQACEQLAAWHQDPAVRDRPAVSVNVSSRHLAHQHLLRSVGNALDRSGLPPTSLTLELTETVLATADSDAVRMLTRLRDLGVSLALDDFGTAYSSLSYLQKFPVSSLKIDRAFVAGLGAGSRDESLVESILHLARRLGLDAVAEGVETTGQADVLRELGCPKAQGYLFARPLPAPEMRARLAR